MSTDTRRFRVGDIECLLLRDGHASYGPPHFPDPAAFLFRNAPQEEVHRELELHHPPANGWTEWSAPYVALAVITAGRAILVDTGAGDLSPDSGRLPSLLREQGLDPGDIEVVIISHGHPDHIGGLTDDAGRPRFPKARHVMDRDEWAFWTEGQAEATITGPRAKVHLDAARRHLPAIEGRVDLVRGRQEVAPGVTVLPAPGHTPGHMATLVASGDEELIFFADALFHPLHARHPGWATAFDLDPDTLEATRRLLLDRAEHRGALAAAAHLPFPGLGHVEAADRTWRWTFR